MSAPAVLETSISEPASPPIPLNRYSSSGSLMGIIGGVSGILSNVISDKSLEESVDELEPDVEISPEKDFGLGSLGTSDKDLNRLWEDDESEQEYHRFLRLKQEV